jgi:hypothetical protein
MGDRFDGINKGKISRKVWHLSYFLFSNLGICLTWVANLMVIKSFEDFFEFTCLDTLLPLMLPRMGECF